MKATTNMYKFTIKRKINQRKKKLNKSTQKKGDSSDAKEKKETKTNNSTSFKPLT